MSATLFPEPALEVNGLALAERYDPTPHEYADDPVGWVQSHDGFLWSKQREIAESVRDNRYTAAHSAHSTGKSRVAAEISAWWLNAHDDAFVVTTAPTTAQIEAILWREIGAIHQRRELPGRITLDAKWYMGQGQRELVAYGRKPQDHVEPEEAMQAFQGIHAKYVLIVIDEACGVPKWLYDAADTLASNENARVLAIGNPDMPGSHFAKVCHPTAKEGKGWNKIHIDGLLSPNFTDEEIPEYLEPLLLSPTWVEERKERWGTSSPLYISKVRGRFAKVTDDMLISPDLVVKAHQNSLAGLDPGVYGCDIARFGQDETCFYRNREGVIRLRYAKHKQDTHATSEDLIGMLRSHKELVCPAIVDADGLGAGVVDNAKAAGMPIIEFHGGERAWEPQRFKDRRSEQYWALRELMEEDLIDLDAEDEDLSAQLSNIKWRQLPTGQIQVERKDEMKKRGVSSPDRADGAMMSTVPKGVIEYPPEDEQAGDDGDLTSDLLEKEM